MAWFKKDSSHTTMQASDSVLGSGGYGSGRAVRHRTPRRWAIAGALVGILAALVV